MRKFGKEPFIAINELITISENKLKAKNIKSRVSDSLKNNSQSWVFIPDPTDGRKILIKYSSIPKQTIEKYNMPSVSDLVEKIKQENEIQKADTVQQQLTYKKYQAEDAVNKAAKDDYIKFMPQYSKVYPNNRDKAVQLAKTHAVLLCCIYLKAGFTIAQIHEAYLKAPGIKISLKNIEKFRQKLNDGLKNGLNVLHKFAATPRPYLVKLTDWHKSKIELYYKDPKQYSIRQISELLYSECLSAGHTIIKTATIEKYLTAEVKNRLSVFRNPSLFKRTVKPFTRRSEPDNAGDLYYADGSPIQIFCWNKAHTTQIRLNLFVVLDVKSKKLVGFDLAESEDRFNWFSAFKMAFSKEMLLPYQLTTDQASVTKTAEFEALKNKLELKGCKLDTTKKGEGQQKADIERWFGSFQSEFQKMIDGYIGEGIRSKRENGRIDTDFLKTVQKDKGFYSYETMVVIITQLISIYNNKTVNSRVAPNQVFSNSEKANMQKIDAADIAVLFWHTKTLKVKNSEVKFDIRKQQYIYEVYNHEIGLKINNTNVTVYYDENDPSTIHLFTLKNEYLCECKQKTTIVKAGANQTEADKLSIIKKSSHNEAMVNTAKRKTEEVLQKGLEIDPGLLQTLDAFTIHKDLYNDAESKANLDYIYQTKGIDSSKVEDYTPTDTNSYLKSKLNKQTVQERHAKKNIVPATLEVIKRP